MQDLSRLAALGLGKISPAPLFGLLVFGAVLLLFGRSVTYDFLNYDDPVYVTENEALAEGLTFAGLQWASTQTGETNLWQPLTFLSHMVDIELFGIESAAGHHAVNVFWHGLAAVGFFFVLRSLFGSSILALFAALLWACHPQRVQSVAWISERKDVLSGALVLWSWVLWEWGRASSKRWFWLLGSFVLFVMAALSKPSVVPLPLVLVLSEWLRARNGEEFRELLRRLLPVAPLFMVSLLVAFLTIWFQQRGGLGELSQASPLEKRLLRMPGVLWWYPQTFVWPFPQKLWVYPQDVRLITFLGSLTAILIASIVLWMGRRNQLFLLGAGVFFLFWLPVSGLVPVSFYNVAERYAYLPHLGLVIVVLAWGEVLRAKFGSQPRWWFSFSAGSLVAVLMFASWVQTGYWKGSSTLFSRERSINPRSLLAPIQLGVEREKEGRIEEAFSLFREALQIDPESGLAATNGGRMALKLGRVKEAESYLREATETKVLNSEQSFLLLSQLLVTSGSLEEAAQVLESGWKRFPRKISLPMERAALALNVARTPPRVPFLV